MTHNTFSPIYKCSAEITAIIVEHACTSDPGITARRLGLVSKYFRAFTEPFEYRALVIGGLEQLKAIFAKLEGVKVACHSAERGIEIDVRHVFIHELKLRHALLAESYGEGSNGTFWSTTEGIRASSYYYGHSDELWHLVARFLSSVSTTLVTLTVFQYSSWGIRPSVSTNGRPLRALSGINFPHLESLTLEDGFVPIPPITGSVWIDPTSWATTRL